MSDSQFHPSSSEVVSTGAFGLLAYSLILAFSLYSIRIGFKSKTSKRFFYSISLLCLLELPRYFGFVIQHKYTSTALYALHLLANSVFFIAFSIVCYQWSGLLKLGTYFKVFYGVKGLVAANLIFTIVDIAAVAICVLHSTLMGFFESPFFESFTFIEAIRNIVYSTFLTYYGLKLVSRFYHFSSLDTSRASSTGGHQLFRQAVCRLTSVLILTSICFVLRMCMLCAKMAALYSDHLVTTQSFPLFGFGWFVFSDFIPRILPCIAFMALMRTRKLTTDQKRSLQTGDDYSQQTSSNQNDTDEFQFVLLASDELEHTKSIGNGSTLGGWKQMDADSLFGGDEDEFDDDDDDHDGEGNDGMGGTGRGQVRGGNVDDLFTVHLNVLNGSQSYMLPSSSSRGKRSSAESDPISL